MLWLKRLPSIFCIDRMSLDMCFFRKVCKFIFWYHAARHVQSRSVFDWTKPDYSDALIVIKFLIENKKKRTQLSILQMHTLIMTNSSKCTRFKLNLFQIVEKTQNAWTTQIMLLQYNLFDTEFFFMFQYSAWLISDWCLLHENHSKSYDFLSITLSYGESSADIVVSDMSTMFWLEYVSHAVIFNIFFLYFYSPNRNFLPFTLIWVYLNKYFIMLSRRFSITSKNHWYWNGSHNKSRPLSTDLLKSEKIIDYPKKWNQKFIAAFFTVWENVHYAYSDP